MTGVKDFTVCCPLCFSEPGKKISWKCLILSGVCVTGRVPGALLASAVWARVPADAGGCRSCGSVPSPYTPTAFFSSSNFLSILDSWISILNFSNPKLGYNMSLNDFFLPSSQQAVAVLQRWVWATGRTSSWCHSSEIFVPKQITQVFINYQFKVVWQMGNYSFSEQMTGTKLSLGCICIRWKFANLSIYNFEINQFVVRVILLLCFGLASVVDSFLFCWCLKKKIHSN